MTGLSIGSTLQNGKYVIDRILGQGGFGITYLATHSILEKQVAIKEFFPKDFCDRDLTTSNITLGTSSSAELVAKLKVKFMKEAKNIAKLHHPNIVPIQDIFEENNTAYYLMDYIEGESLGERLKKHGELDEKTALKYILQISSAIDYMHTRCMNHLDIKPGNIMVRSSDDAPILIDFGTSKQYDNEGEQTSTMPPGFTHGYAPMEQYKPGGVATFTPQTDIYALGATLFALLTGSKPPHYSEILEDGLPGLPEYVSDFTKKGIEHAMEVRKNKRPASITEFVKYFQSPVTEPLPNLTPPTQKPTVEKIESDDTVFANLVKKPNEQVSSQHIEKTTNQESRIIDGIEFVDLGLSVLWAKTNVGAAAPYDFGNYINKVDPSALTPIFDFNLKGALVPTISQFEELRNHCHWELTELNDVSGYLVKGKNGNSIFLPFTGEGHQFRFTTFGRLFTRESIYNNTTSGGYFFYYNSAGVYKNTQYSCDFNSRVRMILPK